MVCSLQPLHSVSSLLVQFPRIKALSIVSGMETLVSRGAALGAYPILTMQDKQCSRRCLPHRFSARQRRQHGTCLAAIFAIALSEHNRPARADKPCLAAGTGHLLPRLTASHRRNGKPWHDLYYFTCNGGEMGVLLGQARCHIVGPRPDNRTRFSRLSLTFNDLRSSRVKP